MTVGVSPTNLADPWLNVLSGTAFAGAAGSYAGLHTGDPGASGAANISAGDSTRKQLSWAAAANGSKALASSPSSWTNGGTSETLSHLSLHSASTAGTFYLSGALTVPQAWAATNTFTLTQLTISITPLAA